MFTVLLKEMRPAFQPFGYLLTAAVSANTEHILQSYEILGLNQHLDFINLLMFDYSDKNARVTGHNAPLYDGGVVESVRFLTSRGLISTKIVMGIPLLGHGYTLACSKEFHVGAKTIESASVNSAYRNVRL